MKTRQIRKVGSLILLLSFFCCAHAFAQQKITEFIQSPDGTAQRMEQYIKTHDVDEMNGDTVTLWNIYGAEGYSFVDDYLGVISRNFYVVAQDVEYRNSETSTYSTLLYVPIKPARYELTNMDEKEIEKKLGYKFALNGDNWAFWRKDKFTVKAEYIWIAGKKIKKVTFHCISYPKYYDLEFKD